MYQLCFLQLNHLNTTGVCIKTTNYLIIYPSTWRFYYSFMTIPKKIVPSLNMITGKIMIDFLT